MLFLGGAIKQMRNKSVSIAMAVCNGEKYIREQLDSILVQLQENDEIIVSFDPSTDETLNIVKEYVIKDNRVKLFYNENHTRGLVSNFQNALQHCKGDIIFYSDQDDVWMEDKIEKVCKRFENPKVTVVIHDTSLTDENLNVYEESTFKLRGGSTGVLKNLIRLSYIGCAMAFRKEMLKVVLPLATKQRSHDWWTGSICSCYGRMEMINEPLILHRIHGGNATPKRRPPISYQFSVRFRIVSQMIYRKLKIHQIEKVY